jgi:hypothetical protein
MRIGFVGGLSAPLVAPYVYFIVARDLLYVGETQKHPVYRWHDHLGQRGSFRLAAATRALIEFSNTDRVGFFAYQVGQLVEQFPGVQLKQATQAVEHEIHMLLRARPSFLGTGLSLISDTEKTAPRVFRAWDVAQAIAEQAASALKVSVRARGGIWMSAAGGVGPGGRRSRPEGPPHPQIRFEVAIGSAG